MKLNNNKIKTKQLLQLHIIKSKIYDNNTNSLDYLPNINISKIVIKLKKSLQIIFNFHKKNKRILFIGIPKKIEKKINLETNHIALPKFYNVSGLFINKSVLKSLQLKNQIFKEHELFTFSNLIYKPDLIVIFNSDNEQYIIKESYRSKIPIIKFNSNFNLKKKELFYLYEIPGNFNFNKKFINDLFFKVINSILNK